MLLTFVVVDTYPIGDRGISITQSLNFEAFGLENKRFVGQITTPNGKKLKRDLIYERLPERYNPDTPNWTFLICDASEAEIPIGSVVMFDVLGLGEDEAKKKKKRPNQKRIHDSVGWGCLYVYQADINLVREWISAAYAAAGAQQVTWDENAEDIEPLHEVNSAEDLATDLVVCDPEKNTNWIAVMSCRWEVAATGKHPLALAISKKAPVLSVAEFNDHSEYIRYEQGAPFQCTVVTNSSKTAHSIPGIQPFDLVWLRGKEASDLSWFNNKSNAEYLQTLTKQLNSPTNFVALMGLSQTGYAAAIESAPLDEYPSENILVFRKLNLVKRKAKRKA